MFTEKERENLAKQYVPLVKKIAKQYYGKNELEYEEIEGFAWEGFVVAMNKYDETRSKLTFQQYAGWGIRNGILNGINTSSRTIKLSYYKQKQMRERGEEIPTARSIDTLLSRYEMDDDHIAELGIEDEVELENPWETLLAALKNEFEEDWIDMFCSIYGLDGHTVKKSKDIAEKYNISSALITIRKNKMINYIKSNKDLKDCLSKLM